MSNLNAELSLEQVEDFFSVLKPVTNLQTTKRSKSGGRPLDPSTGLPSVVKEPTAFVPSYKRHAWTDTRNQKAYAERYKRLEDERIASEVMPMSSKGSTVSGMMEQLEIDSTITGLSTILPEGKSHDDVTALYKHYNFRHEYDKNLTITPHKDEIVENINSNQVVVIHGATGSGKTTQVPQYLLDHYAQTGRYCNIIVTQPRRIAAQSIAKRVCIERGWQLGGICGYQVGLDREASDDTRILYCTTAVLFNKLINQKTMQHYTHVILDEVHERDQDTDFCLIVVKKLLNTNSRDVKVVLMSATAEAERFADYFSVPISGQKQPAPIIEISSRTYNIAEYYVNDLEPLGQVPPTDIYKPGISPEQIDLTLKLVSQFDVIEAQYSQAHGGEKVARGAVLIFLPGLSDINDLESRLMEEDQRGAEVKQDGDIGTGKRRGWWIIPLHSTITGEEQARVFHKPQPGLRKIILSTNVAESSITVPDVKYVIDFCLTKCLVMDPDTSYTCLQVQWAAKSNCIQRAGRAGRVSDGRVYKMVTRRFYREQLPDHGLPEMERCPLTQVILKAKLLDHGEPKAILGQALNPPNLDNIELNILKLKQIGALAPKLRGDYNPHDGEMTFMGRVLAELPVDVRIGKLMLLGHVFGVLEDTIIIAAALTEKSFFATPYKSYLNAYKKRLKWSENSFSDCIAYLNAYKVWQHRQSTRAFSHTSQERSWGTQAYIQIKKIKDVGELVWDLTKRLRDHNIRPPDPTFLPGHQLRQLELPAEQKQLLLKLVLCGAFYPNYFMQGPLDIDEANRGMSGKDPKTTVMVRGFPQNQGALYRRQVENLFMHCETVAGAKPKVTFEESKAFIEFTRDPSEDLSDTSIIPPVYVAIKMRLLRIPLMIELYDQESANSKLRQIAEAADERARKSARLRTNRVKAVREGAEAGEESKVTAQSKPRQVELPTATQSSVSVYVTEVVTCGHFWGHYNDPDTWKALSYLQSQINQRRGFNLAPVRPNEVDVGMLCLAPYCDGGSAEFYRATVKAVDAKQGLTVFFLDYGNTAQCSRSELRALPQQFLQLPFQAIEWQLAELTPSPLKCPNARWTPQAKDRFAALVAGKGELIAEVYSIVHGVVRITLYDGRNQNFNINERLINENFANKAPESLLSKQNREQREIESQMLPSVRSHDVSKGFDLSYGGDGDNALSDRSLGKLSHSRMSENWLEIGENAFTHVNKSNLKSALMGPVSMYEMKFYSMTAVGAMREAKIDRESINCVAISNTTDSHPRMMVAAHVGLNPSGSILMARNTTVLPNIPGLAGLLALCFCPFAEMRCDPDMRRYTGALCGLGFSQEWQGPVMPEDDMEVTFDTHFDQEDLKTINGIRMGMYIAIGNERTAADWGPRAIVKIQNSTRRKLLDLVSRRREAAEKYFFPKQHVWQCVHPDDLLYPELDDLNDINEMGGLTLHCGIALNSQGNEEEERLQEYMQEWLPLQKHVKFLHSRANRLTIPVNITCELCDVTLKTPRELGAHLALRSHRKKEEIIQEHINVLNLE